LPTEKPIEILAIPGTPRRTRRAFRVTSSAFCGNATVPDGRAWETAPYAERHSTRRAGVGARTLRRTRHRIGFGVGDHSSPCSVRTTGRMYPAPTGTSICGDATRDGESVLRYEFCVPRKCRHPRRAGVGARTLQRTSQHEAGGRGSPHPTADVNSTRRAGVGARTLQRTSQHEAGGRGSPRPTQEPTHHQIGFGVGVHSLLRSDETTGRMYPAPTGTLICEDTTRDGESVLSSEF